MIKNIIFDFGDIFINLDKEGALKKSLELFNVPEISREMSQINIEYEEGLVNTETFLQFYKNKYPLISEKKLVDVWNSILLDFPQYRLDFLKKINKKYRCFLLSNTNELHIEWIKNDWGLNLYNDFKNCFEKFYLSHEIKMRKPNSEIYKFVLNENNLKASETLFIDDTKDNTDSSYLLGIHSWNLIPGKEDIIDLFNIKSDLF